MSKSPERIEIESDIHQAHNAALVEAMKMVEAEYGGDMDSALSDPGFIARMQKAIALKWQGYHDGYKSLEGLESREENLAMREYDRVLNMVAQLLPKKHLQNAYYPYSGLDLYWAKIFEEITFQDIGFDGVKTPNLWWRLEDYSKDNRERILKLLDTAITLNPNTVTHFLGGNVEKDNSLDDFNQETTTLLIKGGHSFINEVQDIKLAFGAIILVDPADDANDIQKFLNLHNYHSITPPEGLFGTDWIAPYAMSAKKIFIYLHEESTEPGAGFTSELKL